MSIEDIDWNQIAPKLEGEIARLQTGAIPDRSYWILKVAAAAKNTSLSSLTASLLNSQVRCWEDSWFDDIEFLAARYGLSFEECFVRLALNQPLANSSPEESK